MLQTSWSGSTNRVAVRTHFKSADVLVFYAWKKVRYNHVIWHGFVVAGSTCHYFAELCSLILQVKALLGGSLSKQFFHGAHRQEEPTLDSGEFEKSILLVERECRSVLPVDDDSRGIHFQAVMESSIERIHQ